MENMTRGERAVKFFEEGYNCSQSTLLAFEDVLPYSREEIAKLGSSFGGGMARLREVCGAVSGIFMVAGLLYGFDDTGADGKKWEHYVRIQELGLEFEKRNGSLICRELLELNVKHDDPTPTERTHSFYQKRKCGSFIRSAADILDAYIKEHPVK